MESVHTSGIASLSVILRRNKYRKLLTSDDQMMQNNLKTNQ